MRRSMLALAVISAPAFAQDLGGMNPADVSRGMIVSAASEAQVGRHARVRSSPERSRQICGDARRKIARGSTDARLPRLMQLCRRGGY